MIYKEPSQEVTHGPTPADISIGNLPTVKLTEQQLQRASQIARQRNDTYQKIDGGRVCGEQESYDAHLTGVVGELAVAVQYDGTIDSQTYETGDDGYDLCFGECTIDVKATRTTSRTRPNLIVSADPTPSAAFYYLTHWVEDRLVRIVGYAPQSRVLDREPRQFPGQTLNYIVPPEELFRPPEYRPPQPIEQLLFSEVEMP